MPSTPFPGSGYMGAECSNLHYQVKTSIISNPQVFSVVGVLSAVPNTLEQDAIHNGWSEWTKNVFFVVAGLWEFIEQEYNHYNNIIWVDTKEAYMWERSELIVKIFCVFGHRP